VNTRLLHRPRGLLRIDFNMVYSLLCERNEA